MLYYNITRVSNRGTTEWVSLVLGHQMIFSSLLSQRSALSRFILALIIVALIWIGFVVVTGGAV